MKEVLIRRFTFCFGKEQIDQDDVDARRDD